MIEVTDSASVMTTCSISNETFTGDQFRATVTISYGGPWYAQVAYADLATNSTSTTTCVYAGTGPAAIVTAGDSYGENIRATAQKLDSSTGNLTISVSFGNGPGFGAESRANSTTLPYGSAATSFAAYI